MTLKDAPELVVHESFRKGLALFNQDRLRWLDEAAALGPLVGMKFGRLTTWIVTDADVARDVLLTDAGSWVRPVNFRTPTRMAIGENLFTLGDREWQSIGPTLSPFFRSSYISSRL